MTCLVFVGVELVVAVYVAHSQSMLTDAMAMSVDALTYLLNLVAERWKQENQSCCHCWCCFANQCHLSNNNTTNNNSTRLVQQKKRQQHLQQLLLEFVPPFVSVVALTIVSYHAIQQAIPTLTNHPTTATTITTEPEPNVYIMFGLMIVNLGLDFVNVTCFAKLKIRPHRFFFGERDTTTEEECEPLITTDDGGMDTEEGLSYRTTSTWNTVVSYSSVSSSKRPSYEEEEEEDGMLSLAPSSVTACSAISINDEPPPPVNKCCQTDTCTTNEIESSVLNVNMCSAYTHVMADTLRSIAVLIASGIACAIPSVSPTVVDATATILVSIIIIISLGPLLSALVQTATKLITLLFEPNNCCHANDTTSIP